MKITLAQLNPTIGDFEGNLAKIEKTLSQVGRDTPDLIVFSELFLSGCPPLDLLEEKEFIHKYREAQQNLIKISERWPQTAILCGTVQPTDTKVGNGLYNSAILIQNGKILFQQNKSLLPTYDVFDEARYFDPADQIDIYDFNNEKLGITICEDAWSNPQLFPRRIYSSNPVETLIQKGATILINISAVPFGIGKEEVKYGIFHNHTLTYKTPFIHLNQTGSNDDLISGGQSMAFDRNGNLILYFPPFREHIQTIDLKNPPDILKFAPKDRIASVHDALILGIRDYMRKAGFKKAVLGLSGGIDSAVTCCLTCAAIGSENVLSVSMPSPYSSDASVEDARNLA